MASATTPAAGTAQTSERWWWAAAASPVAMSMVRSARGHGGDRLHRGPDAQHLAGGHAALGAAGAVGGARDAVRRRAGSRRGPASRGVRASSKPSPTSTPLIAWMPISAPASRASRRRSPWMCEPRPGRQAPGHAPRRRRRGCRRRVWHASTSAMHRRGGVRVEAAHRVGVDRGQVRRGRAAARRWPATGPSSTTWLSTSMPSAWSQEGLGDACRARPGPRSRGRRRARGSGGPRRSRTSACRRGRRGRGGAGSAGRCGPARRARRRRPGRAPSPAAHLGHSVLPTLIAIGRAERLPVAERRRAASPRPPRTSSGRRGPRRAGGGPGSCDDLVDAHPHVGGDALDGRDQRLAVGLAGGQVSKHARHCVRDRRGASVPARRRTGTPSKRDRAAGEEEELVHRLAREQVQAVQRDACRPSAAASPSGRGPRVVDGVEDHPAPRPRQGGGVRARWRRRGWCWPPDPQRRVPRPGCVPRRAPRGSRRQVQDPGGALRASGQDRTSGHAEARRAPGGCERAVAPLPRMAARAWARPSPCARHARTKPGTSVLNTAGARRRRTPGCCPPRGAGSARRPPRRPGWPPCAGR